MKEGYIKFLNTETPPEGGCMVCEATNDEQVTYLLIERHQATNGTIFTINGGFYFEYDFLWDDSKPWKVIYKKTV